MTTTLEPIERSPAEAKKAAVAAQPCALKTNEAAHRLQDAPAWQATAVKIALGCWLAAWVLKAHFFVPYFAWVCPEYPFRLDFFPAAASNAWVSLLAYALPLLTGIAAIGLASRRAWQLAAFTMVVAAGLLAIHLNSYNDATFVTSFWAALWILWLATRNPERPQGMLKHGPILAQAVVSLMFLGGAVGKLTADYWQGTALYHIYFLQKNNFIYPWLRETLSAADLQTLALWFSRCVIVAEFAVAALILCASRKTLLLSAAVMIAVAAISTSFLFSVMGSLIGVAWAGAKLAQRRQHASTATAVN